MICDKIEMRATTSNIDDRPATKMFTIRMGKQYVIPSVRTTDMNHLVKLYRFIALLHFRPYIRIFGSRGYID